MSSSEFSRICRELYSINETVNIEADKNYIKFYVNNENIGGGFTLESNDSDNTELQCKIETDNVVNLAFALRYLNMFTKASSIGQQVNLFLSKEFPLMVQYKLAELGVLKFYLAPRISESEKLSRTAVSAMPERLNITPLVMFTSTVMVVASSPTTAAQ